MHLIPDKSTKEPSAGILGNALSDIGVKVSYKSEIFEILSVSISILEQLILSD